MVVVPNAEALLDEVRDHRTSPHAAAVAGRLWTDFDEPAKQVPL